MNQYHLAQVNIARMLAPIESETMADFVALLDTINAVADAAPGFVWRLKTEGDYAVDNNAYDDPFMLLNMSVWETIDALRNYVFDSDHVNVLRRRKNWFETSAEASMVLWWVDAGHLPNADEAKQRLEHLREHGPTQHAFTFKDIFPPVEVDR